MDLFEVRARERLLTLVIGGFSILLGFLLFIFIPLSKPGDGTVRLPGFEVVLTHVGPGVFFAVFGAAVLWLSIRTQLQYSRQESSLAQSQGEQNVQSASKTSVAVTYMAATEGAADRQAIESLRSRLLRDFRTLDRTVRAMEMEEDSIGEELCTDFALAVPRMKEALMFTAWDEDWGDYATFSRWVRSGCPDPPPPEIEQPSRFFQGIPGRL